MRIFGNTDTLKPSQLKDLERLHSRRTGRRSIVSPELAAHIVRLSFDLNSIVACTLDRNGQILHVIVGDTERVFLPNIGRSRSKSTRFRGIRLIRSSLHTSDAEQVNSDDVTDLTQLQLDAVVTINVLPGGFPGRTEWIHLIPPNPDRTTFLRHEAPSPSSLNLDFEHFITELEAEFQRKAHGLIDTSTDGIILVHLDLPNRRPSEYEIAEMRELCRTSNLRVDHVVTQRRAQPHPQFAVGPGKIDEIERTALQLGTDLILFSHDLLPRQLTAISERTNLRVVDRTQLILDIFASHASTVDARTQVELAQLTYNLPRLSSKNTGMSRLTGGIGGRGPGETKLEINRRRARERILKLEKSIEKVSKQRNLQRSQRRQGDLPIVAIVGYTNAGKSTLLNRLTQSDVLEQDLLFATLRPTTRRLRLPTEVDVLFTDTVGFIHNLPSSLIQAFKATLEELDEADLLVHVVDASTNDFHQQIDSVQSILKSLDLHLKEQLLLFNKSDLLDPVDAETRAFTHHAIPISALDDLSCSRAVLEIQRRLFSLGRISSSTLVNSQLSYTLPEVSHD